MKLLSIVVGAGNSAVVEIGGVNAAMGPLSSTVNAEMS
jgi:hypothetical protein